MRQQWSGRNYQTTQAWVAGIILFLVGQCSLQAADEEVLELDRFQVTGTNIKRTDFAGPSPLVIVDQTAIKQSGATTISELFRDVIYNSQGLVDETFTQGFAPASAGVDLRGLGVNRTLVLVNGRRVPLFPFGSGWHLQLRGHQSDTPRRHRAGGNPQGWRLRHLRGGCGGRCGQLILRKSDYEGVEVSAESGQTDENDGEATQLSLTGGAASDKGNVTFTLDYLNRDAIWARDRDISASADGPIDDRSNLG